MDGSRMKAPLYICVYVPEFAAQARLRLRPQGKGKPVAILAGHAPFEEVCSVNSLATRLGVAKGMTRAELESFPGLMILRRSEQEELSTQNALLDAAFKFTPRVEVNLSNASSFAMVLDMTGTTRIFGTALQALGSIRQAILTLQLVTQLSASTNFYAAVCLAPSARKVLLVIPEGREREYLSKLPLTALPLSAAHLETFTLWGLHTLGELASLPEVELIVRLGQEGKRLRLMARGEHPHLMVPRESVFMLEECFGFDEPVEQLDSLLFVLGPMLDQLILRAQNHAYALASVTVKLVLDGGKAYERTVRPALPVTQREVLLKILHLDMEAHPPSAGVMNVILQAEPGERSKVQLGLFVPQLPEPLRLDVTLARIAAFVGEERVGRARLRDTHCPNSFTMERFGLPEGTSNEVTKHRDTRHVTALRRCRPRVPLSMHQQGSRLDSFSHHGQNYTVQKAYGPWRKSGQWWSCEAWSCEEWDVFAIANGMDAQTPMLCVITHDLLRNAWCLEALYD